MAVETNSTELFVIMHHSKIWQGEYFTSSDAAKKHIEANHPHAKFDENSPNHFLCSEHGLLFEVVAISEHK